MILLEILGSTLAVIPLTFSHVMGFFLKARIDLPELLSQIPADHSLAPLIYEAERLNPNMPVRMREARVDKDWEQGSSPLPPGAIRKGDTVAALVSAANMDPAAWPYADHFIADDLGVSAPAGATGPMRPLSRYLMFGVQWGDKYCWGADRVAMPVLEACLAQAGRLQGLRGVAGPKGAAQLLAGVTIGMPARFSHILPKTPRKPVPSPS